jgi:hypothetical protein
MAVVIKLSSKKKLNKRLSTALKSVTGSIDAKKYAGVIKLKEDAVLIQKRLRNEWQ